MEVSDLKYHSISLKKRLLVMLKRQKGGRPESHNIERLLFALFSCFTRT